MRTQKTQKNNSSFRDPYSSDGIAQTVTKLCINLDTHAEKKRSAIDSRPAFSRTRPAIFKVKAKATTQVTKQSKHDNSVQYKGQLILLKPL